MYNYDFKKDNESIVREAKNINIKMNGNYYQTSFVLTAKNLLVFHDINNGDPIWGVGTYTLPELYLLFSVPLTKIKYEIKENNLYIIIDNQKINCYDFDLENFLKLK